MKGCSVADDIRQRTSKGVTLMSTANRRQRLNDLFGYIRPGKIIEAMNEFYDKDTVMQENANPPTKGLGTNIEREKQAISGVKELKGFTITASSVGDNVPSMNPRATLSRPAASPAMLSRFRWRSGRTEKSCTSGSIMTRASTRQILFTRGGCLH